MAQRIDFAVSIPQELGRLIGEQLHSARICLKRVRTAHAEEPIHEFRKTTKRLRATLRALAEVFPEPLRQLQLDSLRSAAALFGQYRDAAVLSCFWCDAYTALVPEANRASWRGIAPCPALAQLTPQVPSGDAVDSARRLVDTCGEAIPDAALKNADFDVYLRGMVRTYRKGRRAVRALGARPSGDLLHRLRRRVKDQYYQLSFLIALDRKAIRAELDDLDRLAELLGDHHDLGNLLIVTAGTNDANHEALPGLREWIASRLSRLERKAIDLGQSVFRERPGKRRRRIRRLYRAKL